MSEIKFIPLAELKYTKDTENWTRLDYKEKKKVLPDNALYVPHGIAKKGDEFILALIPKE
jgi:hypothetical protein